ncbi:MULTISPECIES: hypothetical protein [Methylobacterium]|uniref:Uncharacterized protein n=2 Tax=Methylobacterium TaxID=407 RepID=A0A0C6FGR0_9HYPH|nr:hypothetical protein [Methylobacterium aquaticum]BAQ44239.1 hypothetical protein Maq22A_c04060 [Methylobacterium aquaticum]
MRATVTDLGLTRMQVHETRQIRNPEGSGGAWSAMCSTSGWCKAKSRPRRPTSYLTPTL